MEKNKRLLGIPYIVIVALSSLVLSLVIIIVLHQDVPEVAANIVKNQVIIPPKSIWFVIGEHIATALFILGIWHSIDQLVIRKEFNSEIIEQLNTVKEDLNRSVEQINLQITTAKHDELFGLIETHHDAYQYDLSESIRTSKRFIAIMADGQAWLNRHIDAFRARFLNADLQTTIILIHPDSDQTHVISRKSGMTPELYKQKIYLTIQQLQQAAAGKNQHLRMLGHSLISCHALYITDNLIAFTPYFMSTSRRNPPILLLKNSGENCFYQKLVSDVADLEKESLEILPEKVTPTTGR